MELRNLRDGDEWMLAEDIPDIDFFFAQVWLRSFVNNMENSVGTNYSKVLGVFNGKNLRFYYGRNDCLRFTKAVLDKIVADPAFGEEINDNIVALSDRLQRHAESIPANLSNASSAELASVIEEHARLHTELYEWGWLSNATDMFYPEFTEFLKNYLRAKEASEEKVNAHFIALTSPSEKSAEALQHEDFLKLAIEVENNGDAAALVESGGALAALGLESTVALEVYARKYEAMGALWTLQPFPLEHHAAELAALFRAGKSPSEELERAAVELAERRELKQTLFKRLSIDDKHAKLFDVFSRFMLTKFHRRYAQLRSHYAMRRVFREIETRFGLSFVQSRFFLTEEFRPLLEGRLDPSLAAEREKFCVLYTEKGFARLFVGEEAAELAKSTKKQLALDVTEIMGQCASLGKARGRVKIILSARDLYKMSSGDVLVAIATNPDVVPAMRKAAAIVAEQGGVTCHAAIVSRELGVPCVIGTKIATKWLKDGDVVEVDAAKGLVKKIS
ncbi:MAG: PEP-utilizing enzyme [Candidatus Micrarchaeota archaeon]